MSLALSLQHGTDGAQISAWYRLDIAQMKLVVLRLKMLDNCLDLDLIAAHEDLTHAPSSFTNCVSSYTGAKKEPAWVATYDIVDLSASCASILRELATELVSTWTLNMDELTLRMKKPLPEDWATWAIPSPDEQQIGDKMLVAGLAAKLSKGYVE